ncbi:2-keto-4-pentenoate hydratase [Aurantiacibacter sediminis]|uniref:Fumarylacetoacetate hydrolase family protein n=1 Tax=Aurantiacibacter sediminis TaxID=2793064 RepID=A0ABS0N6M6_9SPHN|nr:fumarylacetoacetate hydrolase family protein [Aurantiacibacter sediminis]MBH5323479.1 fumarylacetoacetate hydrolase family protein [Aurantiacibacter sediminis]
MAASINQDIAARLRDAYSTGPIPPIRDEIGNAEDAYAIQKINTQHWLDAGRRLVGRKIGLTSPAVQKQLGVDQPDFGALFADMEISEHEELAVGAVNQPKIEAEIAFVLGRDIGAEQPGLGEVIAAIDFALPAFEIVGSRIANWDIRFFDTVADNASSGYFVLGGQPRPLSALDLYNCKMELRRGHDGDPISTGEGRACLGNPLNAVRWLATVMAKFGAPLKAGDVVLSGALGPMVAIEPGDHLVARVEGLGEVSARFAAE